MIQQVTIHNKLYNFIPTIKHNVVIPCSNALNNLIDGNVKIFNAVIITYLTTRQEIFFYNLAILRLSFYKHESLTNKSLYKLQEK